MDEIIELLKDMVSNGHAPTSGCRMFGIGYEDGFARIKLEILENRLKEHRKSAEKFVIGPYGSGKTHFLRQLIEIAREIDFVSSEVQLSRNINLSDGLVIYGEVTRNITAPGQNRAGMDILLEACIDRMRGICADPEQADEMLEVWIDRLKKEVSFENKAFQRVLIGAIKANISGEEEKFEKSCRWLTGDISNTRLSNELNVSKVSKAEYNRFGETALFSLCQFIKEAGFAGTILALDEAEQSTSVPTRKLDAILSMLRSEMDSITRVRNAALLKVYAFTPDVVQKMKDYPALQQRISDPDPERDFFDGETYAPMIDLSRPFRNVTDSLKNLEEIGIKLVQLFFDQYRNSLLTPQEKLLQQCRDWAETIAQGVASITNRREMIKRCSSHLIQLYHTEVEKKSPVDGTTTNPILKGEDEV